MRYLVFTNTPAHVHLYRNAVRELDDRGHEVLVLGRDDSHTLDLLEYYGLPYEVYGERGPTKRSLAVALPSQFASIFRRARAFDPDVVFGRGTYAAFAGSVTRARTTLVMDSIPWRIGYLVPSKVADTILTTEAFAEDLGDSHYRFRGFTECAYLHPDVFDPDPSVRADLGVDPDERFAVVRLNGFGALHDVGERGFSREECRRLIRRLADHATVFVSDEAGALDLSALPARRYDLHPARVHDALAAAHLFVGDTGTMTTEAALVGTPAIRVTTRETDLAEFEQLSGDRLVRTIPPSDVVGPAVDLLTDDDAPSRWRMRRDEVARELVNLTPLLVEVAEAPDRIDRIAERSAALEPVVVTDGPVA